MYFCHRDSETWHGDDEQQRSNIITISRHSPPSTLPQIVGTILLMRLHVPLVMNLLAGELIGCKAFVSSLHRRIVARNHISPPTPKPKLRRFISVGDTFNHATTSHARNANALRLFRVNDDALGTTSSIGDLQIHVDDDSARQIRKERLHHHLRELGVDADLLEDAAFRSVTTTGECIPGDLGGSTIHSIQPRVNSCLIFYLHNFTTRNYYLPRWIRFKIREERG